MCLSEAAKGLLAVSGPEWKTAVTQLCEHILTCERKVPLNTYWRVEGLLTCYPSTKPSFLAPMLFISHGKMMKL